MDAKTPLEIGIERDEKKRKLIEKFTYYDDCVVCEVIKLSVPMTGCFLHDYVIHMLDHKVRKLMEPKTKVSLGASGDISAMLDGLA